MTFRLPPVPSLPQHGPHPLDGDHAQLPVSLVWGQGWLDELSVILLGPLAILFGAKPDWGLPSAEKNPSMDLIADFATNPWFRLLLGWVVWFILLLPGLLLVTLFDLIRLSMRKRPYKMTLDASHIWIEKLGFFGFLTRADQMTLVPRAQLRDITVLTFSPSSLLSTVQITTDHPEYPAIAVLRAKKAVARKRAENLARLLRLPLKAEGASSSDVTRGSHA